MKLPPEQQAIRDNCFPDDIVVGSPKADRVETLLWAGENTDRTAALGRNGEKQ